MSEQRVPPKHRPLFAEKFTKKWSGKLRKTKASLYTHVEVRYEGSKNRYRVPRENWESN